MGYVWCEIRQQSSEEPCDETSFGKKMSSFLKFSCELKRSFLGPRILRQSTSYLGFRLKGLNDFPTGLHLFLCLYCFIYYMHAYMYNFLFSCAQTRSPRVPAEPTLLAALNSTKPICLSTSRDQKIKKQSPVYHYISIIIHINQL